MSLYAIKQSQGAVQDWQTQIVTGKVAANMPGIFDLYDSLGNVTINTDTQIPSVLDGPMVCRRYNSLTIDAAAANVTLTTQYRCRGLLLLIDGNLTLQRTGSYVASISMTARGARGHAAMGNYDMLIPDSITLAGKKLLQRDVLALLKTNGYAIIDRWMWDEWGKYLGVSATAWTGGTVLLSASGCGTPVLTSGGAGVAGLNGASGSGGCGAWQYYCNGYTRGGKALPWGGGIGSSGVVANSILDLADDYGGKSNTAAAAVGNGTSGSAGGGAGNPGSPGAAVAATATAGGDGTGGVLIIVVKGSITVNVGCVIQADGMPGGNAGSATYSAGGGGSGGGHVSIIYGGTHTNSGTERANGGPGGTASGTAGGAGGAGSVVTKTFGQMGWS